MVSLVNWLWKRPLPVSSSTIIKQSDVKTIPGQKQKVHPRHWNKSARNNEKIFCRKTCFVCAPCLINWYKQQKCWSRNYTPSSSPPLDLQMTYSPVKSLRSIGMYARVSCAGVIQEGCFVAPSSPLFVCCCECFSILQINTGFQEVLFGKPVREGRTLFKIEPRAGKYLLIASFSSHWSTSSPPSSF